MRTTLTLEDDVAALLNRVRRSRDMDLKTAVNAALRQGLPSLLEKPAAAKRFRTETISGGRCYVADLDDVAGVLAAVEGDGFK